MWDRPCDRPCCTIGQAHLCGSRVRPGISTTESFVLQKLIKCRGTQAFVHRCCWRNDQFPTGWVISNRASFHDEDVPLLKRFCTNAAVPMSATIFPLSNLGVRPTFVAPLLAPTRTHAGAM